jgi:hypothetical protein
MKKASRLQCIPKKSRLSRAQRDYAGFENVPLSMRRVITLPLPPPVEGRASENPLPWREREGRGGKP